MVRVKKNTGGVKIRVTAKAGGTTVDLSAANGVLAVAAGDNLASLAPMALPAANVTYNAGAATILIPSSTGSFVQALIRVATPPPASASRWLVVPDKRHATGDKRGDIPTLRHAREGSSRVSHVARRSRVSPVACRASKSGLT